MPLFCTEAERQKGKVGKENLGHECLFRQMDSMKGCIWKWKIWKLIPIKFSIPTHTLGSLHIHPRVHTLQFECDWSTQSLIQYKLEVL